MSRPRLFLFSGRLLPAFTLRIGALSAALLHQIVKIARRRLLAGARKLLLLRAADLSGCLQMLQAHFMAFIKG